MESFKESELKHQLDSQEHEKLESLPKKLRASKQTEEHTAISDKVFSLGSAKKSDTKIVSEQEEYKEPSIGLDPHQPTRRKCGTKTETNNLGKKDSISTDLKETEHRSETLDNISSEQPTKIQDEITILTERELELDKEIQRLNTEIGKDNALTTNMEQLHEYNKIKDITQIVIGHLSHILDIPVTQLHEELNLTFED